MEDKCKNYKSCEKGASGCDTGEPCVLAFLKALQERYFYHGFNESSEKLCMGYVLTSWEHRLGTLNKPAEDLIATIKTDALTMIVQHSKKDMDICPIRWLCGSIAPCYYATSKVNDKEELLTNRRLVLLEYPFLINFAAAKRIAGWKIDADEILDFYKTFSFQNISKNDAYGLKNALRGFLEMLCNAEENNQKRAIEACLQSIIKKREKLQAGKPTAEGSKEEEVDELQNTIVKSSKYLIQCLFNEQE